MKDMKYSKVLLHYLHVLHGEYLCFLDDKLFFLCGLCALCGAKDLLN